MSGSLTLGGMCDGLNSGEIVVGPTSVNGKRVIGSLTEVNMEANVDYVVKVPTEAVQWFMCFGTASSAPELKVGSNLVTTTNGMPIAAQGFASCPLYSSVTELKLKATSAPVAFQLGFV